MQVLRDRVDYRFSSARRVAGADEPVSLIPVILVIYAALLPREFSFSIGNLALYADRLALIIAMPWVIFKMSRGAIRFVLPDFLMLFSAVWTIVALWALYGADRALTSGGSIALDATVGYYIARISFRSLTDVRRILIALAPGLGLLGIDMILESVTHVAFVSNTAQSIFGHTHLWLEGVDANINDTTDIRLGLMRAKGPFSHSIHAGVYLASMAALYGMSGLRGWPMLFGRLASLTSFFALSSAGFGTLAISFIGMFYDWIQRRISELSWKLGFIAFGVVLFVAQTSTNIGAIGFIQRYLTLDASTAFYRQLIWHYGTISVWAHPLFGIGFEEYERPFWMYTDSVDAHWLAITMRSGLPALALLVATVMAIVALGKASLHVPYVDQRFYRGIAISLTSFSIAMFSVTLWGSALSWFNILLGMCVACAQRSYSIGYRLVPVSDAKVRKAFAHRPRPVAAQRDAIR